MLKRVILYFALSMYMSSICVGQDAHKKLNVLFIVSDDLCTDLGAYGAPVKSPNIDRLASRGLLFERAYCQYPLCGPSRCSFLSGRRPNSIGVLTNDLPVRHKIKDIVTLPQLFRQNGYFSARVGKLYHLGIPGQVGKPGPDDPPSWDHTFNPKGAEFTTDGDEYDPNPKNGQSFRRVMGKGEGVEQADYQSADEAIRLLDAHKDQPFFLAVGFIRPHVPEIAPKKYFDLYPLESVKLPQVPTDDRDDIPSMAFQNQPYNFGMSESDCRESIRAYHATTSFMDAQAGRVLDELDRLKLTERTIIVFISDHGYSLGQHGAWQKLMLFDRVCRVPMIISLPGAKPARTKSLAELVDLYPTLAELCGLKSPDGLEGVSLAPVRSDPTRAVNAVAFTQITLPRRVGQSVRDDRWRYTEWGNRGSAGVELYDEQNDAEEFQNLAKDSQYAEPIIKLREILHRHYPATSPTSQPNEPANR
jgi:iduronate 2-sulfatase